MIKDGPRLSIRSDLKEQGKPPFLNLPSYLITTTVLSYMGFQIEVFEILQYTSHASRAYYIGHKSMLEA